MKKEIYILVLAIFAFCAACKKEQPPKDFAYLKFGKMVPDSGRGGDVVTISGEGFLSYSYLMVQFNGLKAKIIDSSKTQIKVIVPEGCGNGSVTVFKVGYASCSAGRFKYLFSKGTCKLKSYIITDGSDTVHCNVTCDDLGRIIKREYVPAFYGRISIENLTYNSSGLLSEQKCHNISNHIEWTNSISYDENQNMTIMRSGEPGESYYIKCLFSNNQIASLKMYVTYFGDTAFHINTESECTKDNFGNVIGLVSTFYKNEKVLSTETKTYAYDAATNEVSTAIPPFRFLISPEISIDNFISSWSFNIHSTTNTNRYNENGYPIVRDGKIFQYDCK